MFRFNLSFALILLLSACSPKFDWREVRQEENRFQVLMPGKAAHLKRDINLDGIKTTMHMTASEVEDISFLVAYVHIPTDQNDIENSKKQQAIALNAMKIGMLKNIQGEWISGINTAKPNNTEVAVGNSSSGKKIKMLARFEQRDEYLIQVIMLGNEKSFTQDAAEMFFDSYKWNP